MQAHLERGRAASGLRSVGHFVILAGAPLIAALALLAPDPALAGCVTTSRPSGVRPASTGTGAHAPTSAVTSGAGGGGVGTLGCANGSSATTLRGLPVATSGRVVEGGVRPAARTATHAKTPTRTTNASAHAVKPAHRV